MGALDDEVMEVRAGAAVALGQLGEKARPAVPALKEALQDPDPWVVRKAAVALRKITGNREP